jgi:HlyD family secretion protein
MDRPLDPAVTRRRAWRRAAIVTAALALAVALVTGLPAWLAPSVPEARLRMAAVDEGAVEATIDASGTVVPEIEEVVSSPVDARVVRILKRAGDRLAPGDALVELDTSEARLAVDRLTQDVAIKENAQRQKRLELERALIDLEARRELKELQLASLRAQLERNQTLSRDGLVSREALTLSELAVSQAEVELRQLGEEARHAETANRAQLAGLGLEMSTLRKEEADARRTLDLARPRAGRAGVLTWTLGEEGAQVRRGDVVARIADLSRYRVEATVSDVHAQRLAAGSPATVAAAETTLAGAVAQVLPKIQNGGVTFHVALSEPAHPALRANLRVDVHVVTGRKPRALRLRRGAFVVSADGAGEVFVLRDGLAVRTPVRFGLASFDHVEVLSGLAAGDRVVISDMRDYQHLQQVRVR